MSDDLARVPTVGVTPPVASPESAAADESAGVWARLVCIVGGVPTAVLKTDEVKVGRSATADVCVPNTHVSNSHCTLERSRDGEVFITDVSSNGTFLNGVRLAKGERTPMMFGDQVDIVAPNKTGGAVSFILQRVLAPKALPLAAAAPALPSRSGQGDPEHDLTCCLCLDIFHQCVSALPCLHKFCAGCLSGQMKQRLECPTCRGPITGAAVDHAMNHIVEAYLVKNPDKRRDAEDLAELDVKDTITHQTHVVHVMKRKRDEYGDEVYSGSEDDDDEDERSDDDDDDGEDDDDDDDEEEDEEWGAHECGVCAGAAAGSVPSITSPSGAVLTCSGHAGHVKCVHCFRNIPSCATYPVPIRCSVCARTCCDALWKSVGLPPCTGATPFGSHLFGPLSSFASTVMTNSIPVSAFHRNMVERQFLMDTMLTNGLTCTSVFTEMCGRLDSGRATFPYNNTPVDKVPLLTPAAAGPPAPPPPGLSSSSYVCSSCVLPVWDDLVFQYRLSIPEDALPAAARGRPNCWYGRGCRTQSHNPSHAQRYSHACPQTSF